MKQIFSAVFESVWKRKETKIFLLFSLYPLVYWVASLFGDSNFMQITNSGNSKVGYLDFADMILNSMDTMILPTLALYFLTISVFRRETDDHTMFMYKDINRKNIFLSKYFSLLLILLVYFGVFLLSSLVVHYTRVVHMDFGTTRFLSENTYYTFLGLQSIFVIFLKGVLSISVSAFISLRFGTGTTMITGIGLSVIMMITSIVGGPIATLFPNGYSQFMTTVNNAWIGLVGPTMLTMFYSIILSLFGLKKFNSMEY